MIIKNAITGITVLLLSLSGRAADAVTQINSNTSVAIRLANNVSHPGDPRYILK